MTDENETTIYQVRATAPATGQQVTHRCAGLAMAHAKAAELRVSGHKDVVMSIRGTNETA